MIRDDGKTIRHALDPGRLFSYDSPQEREAAIQQATTNAAIVKRQISNRLGRFVDDGEALYHSRPDSRSPAQKTRDSLWRPKPKSPPSALDKVLSDVEQRKQPDINLARTEGARLERLATNIREIRSREAAEAEQPDAKLSAAMTKLQKIRERLIFDELDRDAADIVRIDQAIAQAEGDPEAFRDMVAAIEQRERDVLGARRERTKEATAALQQQIEDIERHGVFLDPPQPEPETPALDVATEAVA